MDNNANHHSYISIIRDHDKHIIGCRTTLDRNERASLNEINEFANICFQQYNVEDQEDINNLNLIGTGLHRIRDYVETKDRGCCGFGHLWFMIKLGTCILAGTVKLFSKYTV